MRCIVSRGQRPGKLFTFRDDNDNEPIIDDEEDMSEGEIVQNGFAIFIHEPIAGNIKNSDIPWNSSIDTPANGLPMIEFNSKLKETAGSVMLRMN